MTAFDWDEFVDFAEVLLDAPLDTPSEESQWRSAVSRAYYGAFGTVRKVLEDEGRSVSDGPKAHGEVTHILNRSDDRERKQAGSHLERMRKRRNAADYDGVISPRFSRRSSRHRGERQRSAGRLL